MLEVGREIFSSHFIFQADFRGSATWQQVIHTLMHSITPEIEVCVLACQTRAGRGVQGLICCRCFIGSVISFYASVITPVQGCRCSAIWGAKTGREKCHACIQKQRRTQTSPRAPENEKTDTKWGVCSTQVDSTHAVARMFSRFI